MANEYGFIYVLGNKYLKDIYKVGRTDSAPTLRAKQLSSATACPTPFDLLMYVEVRDPVAEERWVHGRISSCRVNENREFFKCNFLSLYESFNRHYDGIALTCSGRIQMEVCRVQAEKDSISALQGVFYRQNIDHIFWVEEDDIPF